MTHSGDADNGRRELADRARILLEINNAIVSHLDLAQVLNAISTCLRREIKHDFAALALYNPELNELRLHALDFPNAPGFMEKGQLIPLTGTPAAVAFSTRKPVLRHRPDFEEFPNELMKRAYAMGIKSGCAVPLIYQDKIVGSMALASLRESAFTEADVELLTQIGVQAAIAVENAQNFQKARTAQQQAAHERDRSRLLLEVNNAVVSHLDLKNLVQSISSSLRQIIPHDGAFFTLFDPSGTRLQVQALDLRTPDRVPFEEGVLIAMEGTPEGEAIASRQPVLVVPQIDLKRFHSPWVRRAHDNGIKSGCSVPLISHDRPLGALSVVSLQESAFNEEDAKLMGQCSSQIAIALENALNFESARSAQKQVTRERDRSRLLLEVNNAVVSHLDLRELLKSISASLFRVVPHDLAFVTLLDATGTQLRVQAFDSHSPGEGRPPEEGVFVPLVGTPEGECIRSKRRVLITCEAEMERFAPGLLEQAREYGIKSGCAVPLIAHSHTLGTISIVSFREFGFTEEDANLLEQCSAQIAIAVQNALNFEAAREAEQNATRERDRSNLLLDINNALISNLDLHGLVKVISASLRQVIHHDSFSLALYDEKTGKMFARALESTANPAVDGFEYDPKDTVSGRAFETGQPFYLRRPNIAEFPSPVSKSFFDAGMRSLYSVPVAVHGKKLGVLTFASSHEDAWTEEEQALFQEITKQVAIAADNAQNFEKTRQAEKRATRERDRSQLLLEINNALVSHLDLKQLVRAISSSLNQVIQHDFVGLAIFDPESGNFFAQAADSDSGTSPMSDGTFYDPEGTVGGLCFKKREPVYLPKPDPEKFPSPLTRKFYERGLKTLYAVPLVVHGRILGAMSISSSREDALTLDDRELFQSIGRQVAIATANAISVRDLEALKDKLAQEKLYLEDEIRTEFNFDEIVGQSPTIREVLRLVQTVAPSDSTVLLLGETGTGKELIARAVHEHSRRKSRTFVKLNCAAIPTGLLESELFGHEKGAFTGAIAQKIGRLELADQGTLFLDEVGDIPVEIQPKLLRALQEREFERLGSTHTKKVSVRLVAATNRDLEKMIETREFRSDLYYRLNVFPIRIPPLRERPGDIPILVRYFAEKFARQMQKSIDSIPAASMAKLQAWHWPGNVRELENLIERSVILSTGSALQVSLPEVERAPAKVIVAAAPASDTLESTDREQIIKVLRETRGILAGPNGAASRLGLKRTTLQYKMKKLGITRDQWWPTSQ